MLIRFPYEWSEVFWLFACVAMLIASALLLRRFGGAPLLLLVIGSAAFAIESATQVCERSLFMYVVTHERTSSLARSLLPFPPPGFHLVENISHVFGSVFFPVGFVWSALRARQTSNQAMQRTAGRSDV